MIEKPQYSGLEHFLVGLSPAYWAYTPLLISNLNSLILLNGIDCIVKPIEDLSDSKGPSSSSLMQSTSGQNSTSRNRPMKAWVLPISKCEICGIVTYAHTKSNGSTHYIVDDGTGQVDCINWEHADTSWNKLPSCMIKDISTLKALKVGSSLCIKGQLKVLSILDETKLIKTCDGSVWEGRTCIREVQVNHMVFSNGRATKELKGVDEVSAYDFTGEALHWLKCLQFQKRHDAEEQALGYDSDADNKYHAHEIGYRDQCMIADTPLYNGAHVFERLPDTTKKEIQSNVVDDSVQVQTEKDDSYILRNYFGRRCKCELSYKDALLYCHCIASTEGLDPLFTFRDALMARLLEIEKSLPPPEKEHIIENGICQFLFKTIFEDEILQSSAHKVVASSTVGSPASGGSNARRLFTNTFHWLRVDGILYLNDMNADLYILLSKETLLRCAIDFIKRMEEWKYQRKLYPNQPLKVGSTPKLFTFQEKIPIKRWRVAENLAMYERRR